MDQEETPAAGSADPIAISRPRRPIRSARRPKSGVAIIAVIGNRPFRNPACSGETLAHVHQEDVGEPAERKHRGIERHAEPDDPPVGAAEPLQVGEHQLVRRPGRGDASIAACARPRRTSRRGPRARTPCPTAAASSSGGCQPVKRAGRPAPRRVGRDRTQAAHGEVETHRERQLPALEPLGQGRWSRPRSGARSPAPARTDRPPCRGSAGRERDQGAAGGRDDPERTMARLVPARSMTTPPASRTSRAATL